VISPVNHGETSSFHYRVELNLSQESMYESTNHRAGSIPSILLWEIIKTTRSCAAIEALLITWYLHGLSQSEERKLKGNFQTLRHLSNFSPPLRYSCDKSIKKKCLRYERDTLRITWLTLIATVSIDEWLIFLSLFRSRAMYAFQNITIVSFTGAQDVSISILSEIKVFGNY